MSPIQGPWQGFVLMGECGKVKQAGCLTEVERRFNAINGYVDGVAQRAIARTRPLPMVPATSLRYERRLRVDQLIDEGLYSCQICELAKGIVTDYCEPIYVKQLVDSVRGSEDLTGARQVWKVSLEELNSLEAIRSREEVVSEK